MLAPLRRCVDGWPCMVDDLRGRRMRTGSKIENPSTTQYAESRELHLLLFNFLSNLNRAAYKWSAEKWVTSPGPPYVTLQSRFGFFLSFVSVSWRGT